MQLGRKAQLRDYQRIAITKADLGRQRLRVGKSSESRTLVTMMISLLLQLSCVFASIKADDYENNLYRYLMNDYTKFVRPSKTFHEVTNVTFGFSLHQIVDVDEKNQVITTSCWLNINWLDNSLTWNASQYDGIKMMHLPAYEIWKPDIILTNNADPEYREVMVSTDVYVNEIGNVTWLVNAIFQSSCLINVKFYPFDDQVCQLKFSSWSHGVSQINMHLVTEEGDLSNLMPNGEFQLMNMTQTKTMRYYSCCPDEAWPVIVISIHLRRRPLYYVFYHILPCALISSMALLGFYIPAETGEKVTMCITTMLSMGVFLKTINESMPPTSEAVPLIAIYYCVSLFIVCSATLMNVITLRLHFKGSGFIPEPVPPWIRKFVLGFLAKVLCMEFTSPSVLAGIPPTKSHSIHNYEQIRQQEELDQARNIQQSYNRKLKRVALEFENIAGDVVSDTLAHENFSKFNSKCRIPSFRCSKVDTRQSFSGSGFKHSVVHEESTAEPAGANRAYSDEHLSTYDSSLNDNKDKKDTSEDNSSFIRVDGQRLAECNNSANGNSPINFGPSKASLKLRRHGAGEPKFSHFNEEMKTQFSKVLGQIELTLDRNDAKLIMQSEREVIREEWRLVSIFCDRVLLLLFIVATGVTAFMILFEPTLTKYVFEPARAVSSHIESHFSV